MILTFIPILLVSTIVLVLDNTFHQNTSKVDKANIDKYLTLSNNNHNVMYFNFDRTQVPLWNLILEIDRRINKQNSFIELFPEFTSYTNTIFLAASTVYSNPSIYGGYLFHPFLKNTDEINFVSG